MKIAIVLNTSWNIYNFRLNFIRTLIAEGHEVHTVAPVDEYTHFLTEAGCIHHATRMDSRGANVLRDAALIIELWSIYRKMRPDIVLHYTIKPNVFGSIAAGILRIPAINNVCGLGTVFLKDNLVSSIAMFLYRVSFRFASRVFFQNADDLALFITKKLVTPGKTDLIPGSGIDLNRFKAVEFSRNKVFTFLLVSRLILDKGVMEFIEAVKQLRAKGINARFQILGAKDPLHKRGISLKTIDGWIDSGIIEYLGHTNDVREFISKADCIVLPSYREGTPRTLLEAASSSKPIIATNVPGCHQVVVNDYNGLLCKLKSSDDLAEKMIAMANFDDDRLKKFGENGRRKMELEFNEKLVIDKYIDTITSLTKTA